MADDPKRSKDPLVDMLLWFREHFEELGDRIQKFEEDITPLQRDLPGQQLRDILISQERRWVPVWCGHGVVRGCAVAGWLGPRGAGAGSSPCCYAWALHYGWVVVSCLPAVVGTWPVWGLSLHAPVLVFVSAVLNMTLLR